MCSDIAKARGGPLKAVLPSGNEYYTRGTARESGVNHSKEPGFIPASFRQPREKGEGKERCDTAKSYTRESDAASLDKTHGKPADHHSLPDRKEQNE